MSCENREEWATSGNIFCNLNKYIFHNLDKNMHIQYFGQIYFTIALSISLFNGHADPVRVRGQPVEKNDI